MYSWSALFCNPNWLMRYSWSNGIKEDDFLNMLRQKDHAHNIYDLELNHYNIYDNPIVHSYKFCDNGCHTTYILILLLRN